LITLGSEGITTSCFYTAAPALTIINICRGNLSYEMKVELVKNAIDKVKKEPDYAWRWVYSGQMGWQDFAAWQ
jgi:hypothetical protein